jgi:hypothetical protein
LALFCSKDWIMSHGARKTRSSSFLPAKSQTGRDAVSCLLDLRQLPRLLRPPANEENRTFCIGPNHSLDAITVS